MEFSVFRDIKCCELTNNIRIRQISTLMRVISDKNDKFYYEEFYEFDDVIKKMADFFNNPSKYDVNMDHSFSYETICSYMSSLLKAFKIVKVFRADVYVRYDRYYDEIFRLAKNISKIPDLSPETFLITQNLLRHLKIGKNQDNMKKLIPLISMIDIDNNDYGILRMSDLINITIDPSLSSEYSYLNLDNGLLNIKSSCTKNRKERSFSLPMEWVVIVKMIHNETWMKKQWLFYTRSYQKYDNTQTLRDSFKRLTGMNYYDIKHQFVTYLHQHSTTFRSDLIARNMGHSLKVAVSVYNDTHLENNLNK